MRFLKLVLPAVTCTSVLSISAPLLAAEVFTDSVTVTGASTVLNLQSTDQNWTIRSQGDFLIQRGGITPFSIDQSAGPSAIFVDPDGDTALGTLAPINDFNSRFHIEDPTPDIAFRTIPGGGILDQTWSLFANDVGFGICDETTYPQSGDPDNGVPCTPFFVQTGSPPDSLVIRDSGKVGVGTIEPTAKLHVSDAVNAQLLVQKTDAAATGDQFLFELSNASPAKVRFAITSNAAGARNIWTFDNNPAQDSFSISKVGTGLNEFRVRSNGDGTFRGRSFATQHINTSSRSVKTDFVAVDGQKILAHLVSLPISQWRYKAEEKNSKHIGPVAEDFREAFGLGDGKTISTVDSSGIALASIKALHQQLSEKDERLNAQQAELELQRTLLLEQQQKLNKLEKALNNFMADNFEDQVVALE